MRTRSKFVAGLATSALLMPLALYSYAGQEAAQPAPAAPRRNTVVLDAGHGGADAGSDLGDKVTEKSVTLLLATKLRETLAAKGFAVVLTRDSDGTAVTAEQRAEIANRSHALACISLHSTRSASGVHIYTSALAPGGSGSDSTSAPRRWETLQQDFVVQSKALADALSSGFTSAHLPADVRTATLPPIDSMQCPAVAVEFTSTPGLVSTNKAASNPAYQESFAQAIATGLTKWRSSMASPGSTP